MSEICQTFSWIEPSESLSRQLCERPPRIRFRFRRRAAAVAAFFLFCLTAATCKAQSRDVICRDGSGEFEAALHGITVRVGAARNQELAARVCEASLSWADQRLVVGGAAPEMDIDAFGVDLGLGVPVVALQEKKSKGDCCMVYRIYSLRQPPTLLRTIAGGEFFSAADTYLDGRVQIWTDDAAAVEGFENLRLRDLDFAPPVVLRFVRRRLLDASSEFRPYYDRQIADERAKLDARDLADFKSSDGRLGISSGIPAVRLIQLRTVKMRVLEIVWAYLYSGREQEAWRALGEMWPAADAARIRALILAARERGIRSQVDGVSTAVSSGREPRVKIFDGTVVVSATPGLTPKGAKPKQEIVPPKVILMERPAPTTDVEMVLAQSESTLQLVIDSVGKVRSAEVMGNAQTVDQGLIKSTSNWKFIPAFNADEPVASRILLGVSLKK